MNKYPFKRYKDSPIIDWEATYTEMPPKVKEYLIAYYSHWSKLFC